MVKCSPFQLTMVNIFHFFSSLKMVLSYLNSKFKAIYRLLDQNAGIQGFSRPGKCDFQIQGFSRISRPRTNPALLACVSLPVIPLHCLWTQFPHLTHKIELALTPLLHMLHEKFPPFVPPLYLMQTP